MPPTNERSAAAQRSTHTLPGEGIAAHDAALVGAITDGQLDLHPSHVHTPWASTSAHGVDRIAPHIGGFDHPGILTHEFSVDWAPHLSRVTVDTGDIAFYETAPEIPDEPVGAIPAVASQDPNKDREQTHEEVDRDLRRMEILLREGRRPRRRRSHTAWYD